MRFALEGYRRQVNVQYRFYSDVAGTVEVVPGGGARDLTASNDARAFATQFSAPAAEVDLADTALDGGTFVDAVDGTWYVLQLGAGMNNITIVAAPKTTPGGAVTYRVAVESASSATLVP